MNQHLYFLITLIFIALLGGGALVPLPPYSAADYLRQVLFARTSSMGSSDAARQPEPAALHPVDALQRSETSIFEESLAGHRSGTSIEGASIERSYFVDPDGTPNLSTTLSEVQQDELHRAFPDLAGALLMGGLGSSFDVPGLDNSLGIQVSGSPSSDDRRLARAFELLGLEEADVVLSINGYSLGRGAGLWDALPTLQGGRVELGILRSGRPLRLVVTWQEGGL